MLDAMSLIELSAIHLPLDVLERPVEIHFFHKHDSAVDHMKRE